MHTLYTCTHTRTHIHLKNAYLLAVCYDCGSLVIWLIFGLEFVFVLFFFYVCLLYFVVFVFLYKL